MVALGVEGGRERKHFGRTEFHAKAAGFAALDDDRYTSFCHRIPPRQRVLGTPKTLGDYGLRLSHAGVMQVTDASDLQTGRRGFRSQE